MSNNMGAYNEKDMGAWQHLTEAVASAIAKVNGIAWDSISKINGIAKASLNKIFGIEI